MNDYCGTYAAALCPRTQTGDVDLSSFQRQLEFLARTSVRGVAINGATGEFCATSDAELPELLECAKQRLARHQVLCGIGSATLRGTLARARIAMRHGADALLLPIPYFFPYRQDDVGAFVSAVANELDSPILLYNLPQFTTGFTVETALNLLTQHANLVGIKDSSGHLDIMRAMTAGGSNKARLIGNDSTLCDALKEGICDGVVSGVACVLPELITAIVETRMCGVFAELQALLEEYLAQMSVLPIPWGLQVTSDLRGLGLGPHALPFSPQRKIEIGELKEWFEQWLQSEAVARTIFGKSEDHEIEPL